ERVHHRAGGVGAARHLVALVGRLARGQLVAVAPVRGRHVDVEGLQPSAAGIADLVLVAALDEEQRAGLELVPALVHARFAAAGLDVEPLVGAAMAVVRIAFRIAGRKHHLRGLRSRVADRDAKALAEAKPLALHRGASEFRRPRSMRPSTSSGFTGFTTCSSMPASRLRRWSSSRPYPVI